MEKITALSLLGKQVLDVSEGVFIGYIIDTFVDDNKTVAGFGVISQDVETTSFVGFDKIKHFSGDVVIIDKFEKDELCVGKTILDFPLITFSGKIIAKVWDIAFSTSGKLEEILLENEKLDKSIGRFSVLQAEYISKIGKEAILSSLSEEELILEKPDEDLYQNLTETFHKSEFIEGLSKKFKDSLGEIGNRVKNIDTDHLNQEFNRFTESVNYEVGKLIDGLMEKFAIKRKSTFDTDRDAIFRDLGGKTVEKPIYDKNEEIILMPGQVITMDKIVQVIENNKLADLYRLAITFAEKEGEDFAQS